MKLSLNWLREFVAFELTAEALAERLTMAGLEVENIALHGAYEHMVAGRIVGLEPHPRADKLAVCTVDAGSEGTLHVVSGAPNLEAGLRVAVALPGATLADGTTVESAEIRGVASAAVLLSEREIGVSDNHDGVMRLADEAMPGTTMATILGTADVVLEVAITPNRGDCLSVVGIAREIAALTGARLRVPAARLSEKAPGSAESIRVEIRDPDVCRRYVARVIRSAKIGPSPLWMRSRLEALGVRAINNVVDVTNYVMLERGQPLHAFDLARLAGGRIVVRRADEPLVFRTLDDVDRSLEADDLVIADAERPVALAGVMGGAASSVSADTTDVLLEAAWFAPATIRRTSRRLGLRSESSLRFERGVDLEAVAQAADRAAELFAKTTRGQVAAGRVDAYPNPAERLDVLVRSERTNRMLGSSFPVAEIGQLLRRVSAAVKATGRGGYLCRVPSYRFRLDARSRFHRGDRTARRLRSHSTDAAAPGTFGACRPTHPPTREPRARAARRAGTERDDLPPLRRHGVEPSDAWRGAGGLPRNHPAKSHEHRCAADAHQLAAGPLSRPRLTTAARGKAGFSAFEIGNVFWTDGAIRERQDDRRSAARLRARNVVCSEMPASNRSTMRKGSSRRCSMGSEWRPRAGCGGICLRSCTRAKRPRYGVPTTSLDTSAGSIRRSRRPPTSAKHGYSSLTSQNSNRMLPRRFTFQPLPKYPAIVRDLAIVADETFEAQAVLETIDVCSDLPVESARLFDLYRGHPLPAGKKSLAYSISYRDPSRTLTDEEVNRLHQSLIERITRELGVALRA